MRNLHLVSGRAVDLDLSENRYGLAKMYAAISRLNTQQQSHAIGFDCSRNYVIGR